MIGLVRSTTVIAVFLVFLLIGIAGASAATIGIENSSATALQTNISAASAGDIFILEPGTYFENDIAIPADITIRANTSYGGSAENTIIDALQAGRIFDNSGGHALTIDNLTLQNGVASSGGAIVNTGGVVVVSASRFLHCSATGNGGAIASTGGNVTITTSTLSDCSASGSGGSIWSDGGDVLAGLTTFTNCTASSGGAVLVYRGTLGIGGDLFTNCRAAVSGGAISAPASPVTVYHTDFINCTAVTGNGGAISGSGQPLLVYESNLFSWCSAGADGGAIFYNNTGARIWQGTLFESCSAAGKGGAIAAGGPVIISTTWFTNCSGAAGGGGIAGTGNTTVEDAHFHTCSSSGGGGAILVESGTLYVTSSDFFLSRAARGGAVSASRAGTIRYSRFFRNTAPGAGPSVFTTGVINATDNWWGSSSDPSGEVSGTVLTDPWLVLGITARPSAINTSMTSSIRANLSYNSAGVNTSRGGHVPDFAISSFWRVSAGTGSVSPDVSTLVNGVAGTVFTPRDGGYVAIAGAVDNQSVSLTVPVHAPPAPAPTTEAPVSVYVPGETGDDGPAPVIPVMTVTVTIGGDTAAGKATVTGTKLSDLIVTGTIRPGPGGNLTPPPGMVYQYISLSPARFGTITRAVLNVSVPQSWLDEHHITPAGITLYRRTATGWEPLQVSVLYTRDNRVYLSAPTPDLPFLAIAGVPVEVTPAAETGTPEAISSPVPVPEPSEARLTSPVTTRTTVPPAPAAQPAAPVPASVIIVIAAIIVTGGAFLVRRWWIRRQNPALFQKVR